MSDSMKLNVYEGDYGAASLDVECLKSILYVKVAKAPVTINVLKSIFSCLYYNAPSLTMCNATYNGFDRIVNYLKSINYNIDCGMSAKQASESHAFISLIMLKLDPALKFALWIEARNREEFTNLWFMKAFPFGFNYSAVKNFKNNAIDLISSQYPSETYIEVVREYVYKSAGQAVSALSTRLGKEEYFFGNSPTTLDIVVYSYIKLLTKLPLPSNDLPNMFSSCPNLKNLVIRIDAMYFPDYIYEAKYLKDSIKVKGQKQEEDKVSYLGMFLLAFSASSLLVYFALTRGV